MNTLHEAREAIKQAQEELAAREVIAKRVGMGEHSDDWPGYTFPGCCAITYITSDGEELCAACMNTQDTVHFASDADGWLVDGAQAYGADVDYPDMAARCAHCNDVICDGIDEDAAGNDGGAS